MHISVSDKTKPEKIAYLKALGATVYVCPASVPADDPRSYYEVAKELQQKHLIQFTSINISTN
jgi:cystathionine beta-synthase